VKRCCLYARCSKDTGEQNPENQLVPLRTFALSQGWTIVHEYVDLMTGSRADRPQFTAMLDAASRREYDICLFWSLDRFSRLSMIDTLLHLKQLTDYGAKYRSLQESFIDTTNPFGDVIVAFIAKIAELERHRIRARVVAGLATARAKGKQLGRPVKVWDRHKARELQQQGMSPGKIGKMLGVPKTTVARELKGLLRGYS
jgi:DNA invertase Pin-like site-specific DNA recombinase